MHWSWLNCTEGTGLRRSLYLKCKSTGRSSLFNIVSKTLFVAWPTNKKKQNLPSTSTQVPSRSTSTSTWVLRSCTRVQLEYKYKYKYYSSRKCKKKSRTYLHHIKTFYTRTSFGISIKRKIILRTSRPIHNRSIRLLYQLSSLLLTFSDLWMSFQSQKIKTEIE